MLARVSGAAHRPYDEDLAHVHDAGFGRIARGAAPVLSSALRAAGFASGTVVDLGCGSGILAEEVARAGYDVVGIDVSEAMIAIARRRVPAGRFRVDSIYAAELPVGCVGIAAVGEVVNYLFDERGADGLEPLFARLHAALAPGGVLLFDSAGPGRAPGGKTTFQAQGEDWALLATSEEEPGLLTRTITTFRRAGELWRRDDEVHRLRLRAPEALARDLAAAGFEVERPYAYGAYGETPLPPGLTVFLARRA
jgi:SAM-dependent methyltransferase